MTQTYQLVTAVEFLRPHNVFLINLDMSSYLLEYYTYRRDYAEVVTREQDEKLKDLIAAFALHLSAIPSSDTHAWTVSLVQDPPYALFVTGTVGKLDQNGITHGSIVGNILTDYIRHSDSNAIHAQVSAKGLVSNSYVNCESQTISGMVETFCKQSEQREMRIHISEDSDTAIGIVALPDYDPEWFSQVDIKSLAKESINIDKVKMRECRFEFVCNCSAEKLLPFFNTLSEQELTDLYEDDQYLLITCPKCGKKFAIEREDIKPN